MLISCFFPWLWRQERIFCRSNKVTDQTYRAGSFHISLRRVWSHSGLETVTSPLKGHGSGTTNVAYPDTNATYWTMPVTPRNGSR
jgi:hypothetical protein